VNRKCIGIADQSGLDTSMVEIPKHPHLTTVMSWNDLGELSRSAYRRGHLNGAEVLAQALEDTVGLDLRTLSIIYPTLNLYRHFIELTLKDFIDLTLFVQPALLGSALDHIKQERRKLSHDLRKAYDLMTLIQVGRNGPEYVDWINSNCADLIAWFHRMDSKGDGFRYTLDRNSQAQFPASVLVDIPALRSMVKCFDLFMFQEHDDLRALLEADNAEVEEQIYNW
jgi:hypothetical protein